MCLGDALKFKKECLVCRRSMIFPPKATMPVNIMVQNIIQKKYPLEHARRQKMVKAKQLMERVDENKAERRNEIVNNLPVIVNA
jgi:hypothetical protein